MRKASYTWRDQNSVSRHRGAPGNVCWWLPKKLTASRESRAAQRLLKRRGVRGKPWDTYTAPWVDPRSRKGASCVPKLTSPGPYVRGHLLHLVRFFSQTG